MLPQFSTLQFRSMECGSLAPLLKPLFAKISYLLLFSCNAPLLISPSVRPSLLPAAEALLSYLQGCKGKAPRIYPAKGNRQAALFLSTDSV